MRVSNPCMMLFLQRESDPTHSAIIKSRNRHKPAGTYRIDQRRKKQVHLWNAQRNVSASQDIGTVHRS